MKFIFRAPKLTTMHSGNLCIELTEEGSWESFPGFAEEFSKQIGFEIIKRTDTVDIQIWKIEYLGQKFNLVYDNFPNGISLESLSSSADPVLKILFEKILLESAANGV